MKNNDFGKWIKFEDPYMLVVHKPSGVNVEHDGSDSIESLVNEYFSQQQNPKNTIIGIVHRIDKVTEGIVILAKKKSILKELQFQFEQRNVVKKYIAIVEGSFEIENNFMEDHLMKDPIHFRSLVFSAPNDKTKQAKTELLKLIPKANASYLELMLHTGRYHQIRAQCSHRNFPILNDVHYGAKSLEDSQWIALLANSIQFRHPVDQKIVQYTIDYQDSHLFQKLKKLDIVF